MGLFDSYTPQKGSTTTTTTTGSLDVDRVNALIRAAVESWARDDSTPIPAGVKLENAPDVFKGTWASGGDYERGDFVLHAGTPYFVLADIDNSQTSPPNDETHFLPLDNVGGRTRYVSLGSASFPAFTAGASHSVGFQWAASVAGTPQTFDSIYFHVRVGTEYYPFLIPHAALINSNENVDVLKGDDDFFDRSHVGHNQNSNSGRHLSLTLRSVSAHAAGGPNGAGVTVQAFGIHYGGASGSSAGATNLALGTRTGSTLVIESSTGTDVTLPASNDSQAGLMADFMSSKLSNVPEEWVAGAHLVGSQVVHQGLLYECIVSRGAANTSNPSEDSVGWRKVSPSIYRGAWTGLSSQTIRAGDIVTHTGRFYLCITTHVRVQNGPDTDSQRYILLDNWGGSYDTTSYYHAGSIVQSGDNLWVNDSDVLATDPDPGANGDTKWHRLSPFTAAEIVDMIPSASTATEGLIEIATNAEGDTGSDASRAMTPAGVRRQTGPRVSAAERSATTPETSVRRFSPADIVAMIGAHATSGGLSSSEVLALFATWARVADTSRIPANKLDTDVVLSSELTTAIANFRTETQINALISTALGNLDAVTNAGAYANGTAYEAGALVRHNGGGTMAAYLCIRDIAADVANSEPGVGSAWRTSWYRIGFEDGPPNALVGASAAGRTVTFTRESGSNPVEVNFPVADRTERGERITFQAISTGTSDTEASPIATDPLSVTHGEGANNILSGVSGNDVTVAAGLYIVKLVTRVDPTTGSTGAQRDATIRLDVRDASDDSVLARSTTPGLISTSAQWVSAVALLDLDADTAVNHYIVRADTSSIGLAANFSITYYRWGESEDTGVGNVKAVELGSYTPSTEVNGSNWGDTGVAAPATVDDEDVFFLAFNVGTEDYGRGMFTGAALNRTPRREVGGTFDTSDRDFEIRVIAGHSTQGTLMVTRNAAGNFVIGNDFDSLTTSNTFTFYQLRGARGPRGFTGREWGPPTDLGTTTFDLTGAAAEIALTDSGGGAVVCPESGYVLLTASIPTLGIVGELVIRLAADLREADSDDRLTAGYYTNNANEILLHVGMQTGASTGNEVLVQYLPGAADSTDTGQDVRPSITRFDLTGEFAPAPGSIAGQVYQYDVAIAQSGHASAARIVAFAGTSINPSTVTVLATLTDLHSARGSVTIPAGISLAAAGDIETIRLEVYTLGQTPATDAPLVYQDYRITARAAAATVHFGRVLSTEDAAAIDFAADDIASRAAVAGDWTVSGIPDDTNEYRIYWAVPSSLTQPTSWVTSGFNVNSSIAAAVERTISGTAYMVYLSVADSPFDHTGNGTTYTVS